MRLQIRCSAGRLAIAGLLASALVSDPGRVRAADNPGSTGPKEPGLIRVLQSDAPPAEKAIACKQLAIYGSKDAVPSLAALLPNPDLSSWARIALEAIPDPSAVAALREAMGKVQGRLLIGVMNSIGYRRDAQAIKGLAAKLADADVEVAAAAAAALGRIGGQEAAVALERTLTSGAAGVRPAAAEGCILCAERWLAEGKSDAALKLYDTVRQATLPKPLVMEATRGSILARRSGGLPLLLEQLRSTDKTRVDLGLRVARELPGRNVTEALVAEISRAGADRQVLILLAVADRSDPAVLPAVLDAAGKGALPLRLAAVGVLERLGNASSVSVLLEAATSTDSELAKKATAALARLPDPQVDTDLLARLRQASGKGRPVLIELAGLRHLDGALPVIVPYAGDADAATRAAAVQTIGAIGEAKQAGDLAQLLSKTRSTEERAGIEKALLAIGSRSGTACVVYLLPLRQSEDSGLRLIALHTLASVGGPDALAAVRAALDDQEEAVQDEAARALSTWPSNWPEDVGVAEPLLALARSGKKPSYQVLGIRGYLQYVQEDKRLQDDVRLAKVVELLPLIKRPEETRLAIAVVAGIPTVAALERLVTFVADPAVTEDACAAIVDLAGKNLQGESKDQPRKALQTVQQTSQNEATKRKASRILDGIK
jgi:HEAT repeat protein